MMNVKLEDQKISLSEKVIHAMAGSADKCKICFMLVNNIGYFRDGNCIIYTKNIIWDNGIVEHINQIINEIDP